MTDKIHIRIQRTPHNTWDWTVITGMDMHSENDHQSPEACFAAIRRTLSRLNAKNRNA